MAIKTKLSLTIFLFFLLALLCSNLAIGREETYPKLKTCKQECREKFQYSEDDKRLCMDECDDYHHQMKEERQKQKEREEDEDQYEERDPELKTCKHQCKQQVQYSDEDKRLCMDECDDYHQMKEERQKQKEHEKDEDEYEEEDENPYVFKVRDLDAKFDREDIGRVLTLNKFSEISKLLQNVEKYGLALLEVKPNVFVSPHHFDSEVVIFIIKGRGIIGLVSEDKTERFNLEVGDMMRVPAGTPMYLVNRDEEHKFCMAAFHMPPLSASAPVNLEAFFGPPGRNPESVLTAFSSKVLQAAFKTPKGELESFLDGQRKGRIFKIQKEDVRGLAPKKKSIWLWPFGGGQFKSPFNIFSNRPSFSNQFGSFFEVGPSEVKSGLDGLDLMLTFANITKGSMSTIYYNTNANKIAVVTSGEGEFEMACPHMSSSSNSKHKKSSISYHQISARLEPGVVFIVPAGHPFVTIASKKKNLQIVCFEVNAQNNKKLAFAGKKNIISALDKTAKVIAFDKAAEEVDKIFKRDEEFFFSYDVESKEESGRADV